MARGKPQGPLSALKLASVVDGDRSATSQFEREGPNVLFTMTLKIVVREMQRSESFPLRDEIPTRLLLRSLGIAAAKSLVSGERV